MKTYKHLFEQMLSPEMVCKCALDAAVGKMWRREVMRAFRDFDKTYEKVVSCARDPSYIPCENNIHKIIDGANHKLREIEKPLFCPEQILHHLLIEPFKPVLMDGLYEQVYGCLPPTVRTNKDGKTVIRKYGLHDAVHRLKKWAQIGKKLFVVEADVHHAYGSVHIPTLVAELYCVISDEEWMRLMCQFLHYDPQDDDNYGLILGHYTSPWLFNFYLKKFDHFAASQPDIKYLRFADNLFIIGTNKRKVRQALDAMRVYLKDKLRLTLNNSTQIYRFEYKDSDGKIHGRAINALGTVIHCDRVTLRKSILMRMRRKAVRVGRKRGQATWYDASSLISRLSWIRCTNTFRYYLKYIKPRINMRRLKKKVRKYSQTIKEITDERRRRIHEGLEKSVWLTGDRTSGVRHFDECHHDLSASKCETGGD